MVYTDLYLKLARGNDDEALELIQHLHPVSEKTPCGDFGNTPLHVAAELGYYSVAEMLIKDKVDINAKNRIGETPLHLAVMMGHKTIVQLLLNNHADASITNTKGETPFDQALRLE